jgi:hypothetical protein
MVLEERMKQKTLTQELSDLNAIAFTLYRDSRKSGPPRNKLLVKSVDLEPLDFPKVIALVQNRFPEARIWNFSLAHTRVEIVWHGSTKGLGTPLRLRVINAWRSTYKKELALGSSDTEAHLRANEVSNQVWDRGMEDAQRKA